MEKYSFHLCVGLSFSNPTVMVTGEGIFYFKDGKYRPVKFYNSGTESRPIFQIILANLYSVIILHRLSISGFYIFGHAGLTALIFKTFGIVSFGKSYFLGLGYEAFLDWPGASFKLKLKNFAHRVLARLSISFSDFILIIENSQKRLFPKLHASKKLLVLENFIDIDISNGDKFYSSNDTNIVLSLGRNCQSKNRRKILDEWAKLIESNDSAKSKFKLIVVSSGLPKLLSDQISALESVEWYCNISDDVFNKLRASAVAEVSFSTQGIPVLTSLEGMAFRNVPIVDNSHGGFFDQTNSFSLDEFIFDMIDFSGVKVRDVSLANLDIVKSRSLRTFYNKIRTIELLAR